MISACESTRQNLVAFVRDELPPLTKARVEAHLSECARCQGLVDVLGQGLQAPATAAPPLLANPDNRRQLPSYQTARPHGTRFLIFSTLAGALTAATAALLVVMVSQPAADLTLQEQPATDAAPNEAATPAPAASHNELAPFVRMLHAPQWKAHTALEGRRVLISLEQGYVAVSFHGGRGRGLRITTPKAVMDVLGTRFFVAVEPEGYTTLGVAEGRVRARIGQRVTILGAGEVQTFDPEGYETAVIATPAQGLLDDPWLTEHPVDRGGERPPAPRTDVPADSWPILEQLEQAESAARRGDTEVALATYRSCIDDPSPAFAPYRELCRLESAQLLGLTLNKRERARDILKRLAKGSTPEVQRQATLSLCELELRLRPCDALACLEPLMQQGNDPELLGEATRLRNRWQTLAPRCVAPVKR